MSLPISRYFARLFEICWSFLLSIFSFRRKRLSSAPELPISSNYEVECLAPDTLGSWQKDKQQFLRRPSLVKASTVRDARASQPHKKTHRTFAPPPPEIYVQDWSSVGINMTDLFDTPSAASRSCAAEPDATPSDVSKPAVVLDLEAERDMASCPRLTTIFEDVLTEPFVNNDSTSSGSPASQSSGIPAVFAIDHSDLSDTLSSKTDTESSIERNESAKAEAGAIVLSLSSSPYASNALSAVSGLLFDLPSFSATPHSIPLPDAVPVPSKVCPQSLLAPGVRDSIVPYPDLFDFSLYTRRVSRDSFHQAIEMPSITFSVDEPSNETCRPVSIYSVHERDRYRNASYSVCLPVCTSSPRREPLAPTLNLSTGRDLCSVGFKQQHAEESSCWTGDTKDNVAVAYDALARCEWTEEEFLKMFSASTV